MRGWGKKGVGKRKESGNGVTCSDLKLPFSSTNTDDIQRYITLKQGKDGKRKNKKAPQSVRAKRPEFVRSEPSGEITSSVHRIGRTVNSN